MHDRYAHGQISRRSFMQQAAALAVAATGFCYGGGIANLLAARVEDLACAVPFYGNPALMDEVANINCPLMIHFAELDKRINASWPEYKAALKEHDKSYEAFMYEGANHGFHNDTTPRYDEEAAKLAWARTVQFFKAHL